MPEVSVVIPTYNCARYITDAIESVLAQTYKDYEIVVVDDGSIDNTKAVLQTYIESGKIKYIYHANQGPGAARNRGIQESAGEFIAFLDADDTLSFDSLERRLGLFEEFPILGMVFSDFFVEKIEGEAKEPYMSSRNFLTSFARMIEEQRDKGIIFKKDLYSHFFRLPLSIWTGTVLVRKRLLSEVGFFRTDVSAGEDAHMWLRITLGGRVGYVDAPLASYKKFRSSLTTNMVLYSEQRRKFYESILSEYGWNYDFTRTVRKRMGWLYFDLAKYYQDKNERIRAGKNLLRAIGHNPGGKLFYKVFLSLFLPDFIKRLVRKYRTYHA